MNDSAQLAGVLMTGLLAGNELGTAIGSHPALRTLPLTAEIEAERALTAHLGKVMPLYMTATVTAAVVAAVDRRGQPGFELAAAAAGATALMLAITLLGNLPLNARTVTYPETGGAREWEALRSRWRRLHQIRVVLDVAAFAALSTAALTRP